MSLTQTLMNGGMIGCSINPARYNHDNGALRIATESVEELHDIFMTTFYATEQAELGAVHEGVALENSSYAAVYEGAVRDAFTKVKEFFKKLWDKVKAWFHSVKRFFDSLFMSGREFVKKYAADIRKATNIRDFSYKMFDYDDAKINSVDKDYNVDEAAAKIIDAAQDVMFTDKMKAALKSGDQDKINGVSSADTYEKYESVKKKLETDELIKTQSGSIVGKTVTDRDEFNEACFAAFRKGAESKDDKDDMDISDLSRFTTALESGGNLVSKIDTMTRKVDKAYKNAIKWVDDLEKETRTIKYEDLGAGGKKEFGNNKETFTAIQTNASKVMNLVSSAISTVQGLHNTYMNEWKTAIKERDSVYKQVIIAGLANHRKNSKKKQEVPEYVISRSVNEWCNRVFC